MGLRHLSLSNFFATCYRERPRIVDDDGRVVEVVYYPWYVLFFKPEPTVYDSSVYEYLVRLWPIRWGARRRDESILNTPDLFCYGYKNVYIRSCSLIVYENKILKDRLIFKDERVKRFINYVLQVIRDIRSENNLLNHYYTRLKHYYTRISRVK